MDEIFEVDATTVLRKVSKTAVTHWIHRDREKQKKIKLAYYMINYSTSMSYLKLNT